MRNKKFILLFLPAILVFLPNLAMAQKSTKGMVLVPDGIYIPFFKTVKSEKLNVKSFYLDIYPVTNEEFILFIKENPKWNKDNVSKLFADEGYLKHLELKNGFIENYPEVAQTPVTNVSWHAANAYCEAKGKRLPTVVEWEYAGNAAITNDERPIEEIVLEWYSHPTPKVLPEIGSTVKNEFGLYDMHGLIWEWVFDFNSIVIENDSRSNTEKVNQNLFCASGSFGATNKEDYASFMRFAYRSSLKSNYTVTNLGFRCAMDASEISQ